MTEFEPDMTNLLIQMRINNIMKSTTNRDEGIIPKPKVIKTETTQKMINEYKEAQNQPLEIGGKKYAYHPAVAVVNLDAPNIIPEPFKVDDIRQHEERLKKDLEDIDYFLEQQKEILKNAEEKYNIELEDIDREIEILTNKKLKPGSTTSEQKKINQRLYNLGRKRNELLDNFDMFKDGHDTRIADALDARKDTIERLNRAELDRGYIKEIETENIKQANITEDANKKKIDEYLENIRILNNKPLTIDRFVGETQEDYLARIQDELNKELEAEDESAIDFQAGVINRKKLLSNLSEVIPTNLNKREDIVRLFEGDKDAMFNVNKYWEVIKKKILSTFKVDDKNITADDYFQILKLYMDKTVQEVLDIDKQKIPETKGLTPASSPRIADIKDNKSVLPGDQYFTSDQRIDFLDSKNELAMIYAQNYYSIRLVASASDMSDTDPQLFIKSFTTNRTGNDEYHLVYSDEDTPGTFKIILTIKDMKQVFENQGFTKKNIDMLFKLGKDYDDTGFVNGFLSFKKMLVRFFPAQSSTVFTDRGTGDERDFITYHKPVGRKNMQVWGAGFRGGSIGNKPSEYKKFGDVLINIKKLNKNNLVVKDKNQASIKAFANTRISDSLHDVILDLLNNIPIKEKDIKILDEPEEHIYNNLIHIAGKNKDTYNTIKSTIKYYKNRFNVLSGEIEAGNDNPKLMSEVYVILNQLYRMGELKQKQVNQIYNELKELQQNI
jgi:hypothetical protein